MNTNAATEVASPPESVPFEARSLLRRAAELGPGYRGRRVPAHPDAQAALAKEFEQAGIEPPAYLGARTRWIARRAKLFEAGDYPDKGVTIAEEDLQALSRSFDLPVPILIEHAKSPLEIGFLTHVEAAGKELFGTLALTEEADALIQKSDARSLSLGLSRDLREIREVSLVRTPRIASAQMFDADLHFWAGIDEGPQDDSSASDVTDPSQADPATVADERNWRERFQDLAARIESERADRRLEELVCEGRLLPAQVPFARALLAIPESIEFDGESQPVYQLLIAMLERQPPHGLFKETATIGDAGAESLFLPEEAEFYRRHFPDVSLDVIAARRTR